MMGDYFPRQERPRKPWVSWRDIAVALLIIFILVIAFSIFEASRPNYYGGWACPSNIKQLGIANKMYADDYDDALLPETTTGFRGTKYYASDPANHGTGEWVGLNGEPYTPTQVPSATSRLGRIWTTLIQPYAKSPDMVFCPSYSQAQFIKATDRDDCDGPDTAEYYA